DDIRETVDNFAKEGYHAIAPALFDRQETNAIMAFDQDGIDKGRGLKGSMSWDGAILDVNAAIEVVKGSGKVGIVGFCMGGSVTWLAAARSPVDAAVGYYGGDIHANRNEAPKCPTMLHFGSEDASIPLDTVEEVDRMYPDVPVFIYEGAGHGFSCSRRGSYHPASAKQAMERTLAFFREKL
ncbi:MAG: dienelactone hydrolase family protein, partial [Alphaproteobacteria bacterium]